MPGADYVLQPAARYFHEQLSEVGQRHLHRALVNICDDPYADLQLKFVLPANAVSDENILVYLDGRFVIVYHLLNELTISILSIANAGNVLADET